MLGAPRTGTSVLFSVLNQVVRLPGLGEGHVMPLYARLLREHAAYVASAPAETLAHALDAAAFRKVVMEHLRAFYARTLFPGAWVDKTPGAEAIAAAALARETFPNARFVLTVRNGIEAVASIQRKFATSHEHACHIWADPYRAAERLHEDVGEYLQIDQFEIANEPARTAERLCAFLDIADYAAEIGAGFAAPRADQLSSHDPSRRMTLAEAGWTAEETWMFRHICSGQMRRLGYGALLDAG